jgi:hypothetical protein
MNDDLYLLERQKELERKLEDVSFRMATSDESGEDYSALEAEADALNAALRVVDAQVDDFMGRYATRH